MSLFFCLKNFLLHFFKNKFVSMLRGHNSNMCNDHNSKNQCFATDSGDLYASIQGVSRQMSFGKMFFWPDVFSAKCFFGQMFFRPDVFSAKCFFGQMFFRTNVFSDKCLSDKSCGTFSAFVTFSTAVFPFLG
jgi:hypothetical protein